MPQSRLLLIVACFLALLSACEPDNIAVIYPAKSIITMDAAQPRAKAIAVADGRIVALGDLSSVEQSLAGYHVRVDDTFAKRIIMPGFVEPHLHPYLAGVLLPMNFITPHD